MVSSFLVLLVSLLSTGSTYRLSAEQNLELQETCGRMRGSFTSGEIDVSRKFVEGNRASTLEFPWAASVNVEGILTASVISPRHILLFNIIEMDPSNGTLSIFDDIALTQKAECDVNDLLLPEEVNKYIEVDFVAKQSAVASPQVAKVIVLDGCVKIDTFKPMILELAEDLQFDENHRAICLSDSEDNWNTTEEFSVFGLGPRGKSLSTAKFAPKECSRKDSLESYVECAKPLNESQGLCAGDFGGGAVAEINERDVLLGVYAEGNVQCKTDPRKHREPEFINIGHFKDSICRQTGICVDVQAFSTTTTTTTVESSKKFTEEGSGDSEETDSFDSEESITAETYERMKIKESSGSSAEDFSAHVKNIHIHIRLDDEQDV
ncbi:unnamed protein product [Caenorhabditis sp. 36 PRJEB53466]|nr:unnamed protein product [Caenorhabditis sp. 36 PRJEB53466]